MSDDRGINRNAEDRDRGRRRHALGYSLLSLLRDERGSPRDTDLVLQGRIGKRGVLPVDCRRAPDGRGSDRRAERHGPWKRTSQLMLASEALREAQAELAHVNRVTTMGQLAASIAHEVNQPLAASVTNAHAGLRWLRLQPPNLEEVREALAAIVTDSKRAS